MDRAGTNEELLNKDRNYKKVREMIHRIKSTKAEKAATKGEVFVSIDAPRPRSATALRGRD